MKTTLYTIGKWYEDKGLVGEKPLALIQTVVCVSGKAIGFGIEASSGSGKSATLDLCIGDDGKADVGLIYQKHVYFKDAGSDKAIWYDTRINHPDVKIIAFRELQKDSGKDSVEAIKSITEGKRASRKVTMAVENDVKNQTIEPRTVVYSLAIENDYKPDPELRRRCIVASTDVSKDQTEAVLNIKAKARWDPQSIRCLSDEDSDKIRRNVNAILNINFKIVNPFAEDFAAIVAQVAPDQKVRSMMEHFWDVVEGVTKINALDGNHSIVGGTTLLVNAQDLAQTMIIYKNTFLRDVYSIPPMGEIVLRGISDTSDVKATDKEDAAAPSLAKYSAGAIVHKWVEVNHIRKAIKEKQQINLSKLVVSQICRQLVDAGYLEDNKEGSIIKYQIIEEMKDFAAPNYPDLIKSAYEKVKAKYSDGVPDKWYQQQSTEFEHPLTGSRVQLMSDIIDELNEDIM